jgi:hypothetical protein
VKKLAMCQNAGLTVIRKDALMAEIALEAKLTCPECHVVHNEMMLADD